MNCAHLCKCWLLDSMQPRALHSWNGLGRKTAQTVKNTSECKCPCDCKSKYIANLWSRERIWAGLFFADSEPRIWKYLLNGFIREKPSVQKVFASFLTRCVSIAGCYITPIVTGNGYKGTKAQLETLFTGLPFLSEPTEAAWNRRAYL